MTPERFLERLANAIRAFRQPKKEKRTNSLQALLALLLGATVAGGEWVLSSVRRNPKKVVVEKTNIQPVRIKPTEDASVRKQPLAPHERKRFAFTPKIIFELLKTTFSEWNADKAPQLAAALAYYTIFSMAPLLIIAIAVAGLLFGQQAAQDQVRMQVTGLVGAEGADFIQSMIQNANKPGAGTLATIIGVVTLLAGAAGVVAQLKSALNTIWNVQPAPGPDGLKGILVTIRQQLLSYAMVLGIGFLLLVSLLLSAIIAGVSNIVGDSIPTFLYEIINFVVSFGVITLLFAAIYKVLPDVEIHWRDVWIGAVITSLLFTIGKVLIGLYLGHSSTASTYGAAGSLVVILLWIYYSAQILFFGAEMTQVYANQYGTHIESRGSAKSPQTQYPTPELHPQAR
jgi:membrane protein